MRYCLLEELSKMTVAHAGRLLQRGFRLVLRARAGGDDDDTAAAEGQERRPEEEAGQERQEVQERRRSEEAGQTVPASLKQLRPLREFE